MRIAFDILFLLALFAAPLAVITGFVVFELGVMTDRPKQSGRASAYQAPRAA
jgi:hypothetical protein